ncbi:MAG: LysR substrate-binding domain-containing protein [Myxococcota bacterium]
METLRAMEMFVQTVEQGSFAAAGRSLGVGASAVSKQVAGLEEELETRLLHRTTRSISLTDEGEYYLQECRGILRRVNVARDTVSALADQTRGKLRVSAPPTLGQLWLSSVIGEFRKAYPSIRVQALLTDEVIDVVDDQYDVAIRVGELADSSMIGRRLADNQYCVCVAPEYLDRAGTPGSPEELVDFDCITSIRYEPLRRWAFTQNGSTTTVDVTGSVSTNSYALMLSAVLGGEGIARLPLYAVADRIESGALVTLFDGAVPPNGGIWALYPSRRLLPKRTESFLEFVGERVAGLSG